MGHRIASFCLLAAMAPAFASGLGMQQAFARDMLACAETVTALRLEASGRAADPDVARHVQTYYEAAEHAAGGAYVVDAVPAARERGLDEARAIAAHAGGNAEFDAAMREFTMRCDASRDAYWRAVHR